MGGLEPEHELVNSANDMQERRGGTRPAGLAFFLSCFPLGDRQGRGGKAPERKLSGTLSLTLRSGGRMSLAFRACVGRPLRM